MKKIVQKMTVKQLMFSFYLLSAVIFSCILFFGFLDQQKNMLRQNNASFENQIAKMARSVEEKCEIYDKMLTKMAYGKSTHNWLEKGTRNYDDLEEQELLKQMLKNYASLDETILDVALFGENGKKLNLSGDLSEIQRACEEIPEKTPYYYTGIKEINSSLSYPRVKKCILLGTRIYSMKTFDREHPIGTMALVLDLEKLMSLEKGEEDGEVQCLVFDRNEELFASAGYETVSLEKIRENIEKGKNQITVNDVKYSVRIGEITNLESTIVLMIARNDLLKGVYRLVKSQSLLFFLALLIEIPLFYLSISWVTRPVNHLVEFLKKNRENGVTALKQRVVIEGPKEIEILGNNINGMLEEMDQMTHRLVDTAMRLYEAEMGKKQAELEYLYAQINPHFLFNTLESIKGCAVTEEAWKSFKMLDALGKMFRYSVKLSSEVLLEDEIKLVKNYFYIQKMRFGEKLEYELEIPENLQKLPIPKMILQPLAENAVIHGIEEAEKGGWIRMEGVKTETELLLKVRNSGNVLSKAQLDRIRKILQMGFLEEEKKRKVSHIGLFNVNNRLKNIYGEESGVTVEAESQGGLCVVLHIPLNGWEEENV